MSIIYYLSSRSSTGIGGSYYFQFLIHKSLHIFVYGLLANSYYYGLKKTSQLSVRKVFYLSLLFSAIYGATDEIHQFFVPGRGAKYTDVLFDILGAYLGLKSFFFFKNRLQ